MRDQPELPIPLPAEHSNHAVRSPKSGEPDQSGPGTTAHSLRSYSRRVGRRQLAAAGLALSERDWQILTGIDAHRYLTTRQIEGFYFHDHATALSGARTSRRVLRRLAGMGVLHSIERRIGGVRAGSASFVWELTNVGARLLIERGVTAQRRSTEPGHLFLDHALAVADAHLKLAVAHRAGQLEVVAVQTEPGCWRHYSDVGGARLVLQPDLHVETVDPTDDGFVNRWFIEVDRGTESLKRLLNKCHRYEHYRRAGHEQTGDAGFPLVVWLMISEQQGARLAAAIGRDAGLDEQLYRVTTMDRLVELIHGGVA